jgi:hypothetical protein
MMTKMICLKSQFQTQCKKKKGVHFANFGDCETGDKIIIQKYHSVCWFMVADACELIYSGNKNW